MVRTADGCFWAKGTVPIPTSWDAIATIPASIEYQALTCELIASSSTPLDVSVTDESSSGWVPSPTRVREQLAEGAAFRASIEIFQGQSKTGQCSDSGGDCVVESFQE
jgi:anti-sigma-K factor RskA